MLDSFDRTRAMSPLPRQPKVYHITHVDNLPAIADEGSLVCDREMIRRGGPAQAIGMSEIKRRRVEQLAVDCHPGTMVGDYVPFYFCPRSVMLYVIHMANHRELAYRGGQSPIVHLEADLHRAVEWADTDGRPWAFSLSNAGTDQNRVIHLYTHERACPEARSARGRTVRSRKGAVAPGG